MTYDRIRLELAGKILAGFCANPSVFAPNPNNGWSLVNCNHETLIEHCYILTDELMKQGKEIQGERHER